MPIENGKPIDLLDYQNRIASGKLAADLHVDPTKPPTAADAQRIENGIMWDSQAKTAIATASLQRWQDQQTDTIKALKLPEGWNYQPGQDKLQWGEAIIHMMNVTTTAGRMANLIDKMHLPVDLPPGAKVMTGANGSNISLDLPNDMKWNDPGTADKIGALEKMDQRNCTNTCWCARQADCSFSKSKSGDRLG